jgi:hypothetical protein
MGRSSSSVGGDGGGVWRRWEVVAETKGSVGSVRLEGLTGWWWTGDNVTVRRGDESATSPTSRLRARPEGIDNRSLTQRRHAVVR